MSNPTTNRHYYTRDRLLSLRNPRPMPPQQSRTRFAPSSSTAPRRPSPPPSPPPGFTHIQVPAQPSPPRSPPTINEDRARSRIARAPYMPDNFATRTAFHSQLNPSASPLTSQEIDALFDITAPFEVARDADKNESGTARFSHFRAIDVQAAPKFVREKKENSIPTESAEDQLDGKVLSYFKSIYERAVSNDPLTTDHAPHTALSNAYSAPKELTNVQKASAPAAQQGPNSDIVHLENWFARLAKQTLH